MVIVGMGMVGRGISELLIRAKVTRLVVVDEGAVEQADLLDGFFTEADIGSPKAQAAAATLQRMTGPEASIEGLDLTLSDMMPGSADVAKIVELIKEKRAELVIACGSDLQSSVVNQACLETSQVWLEALIEDPWTWHIQKFTPGVGACNECLVSAGPEAVENPNLEQVNDLSYAANVHSLVWMVITEAVKHFVGGARPFYCNSYTISGITETDMTSNPFCSNPLCVQLCGNEDLDICLEVEEEEEEKATKKEDGEEGVDPDVLLIRKSRQENARYLAVQPVQETKQWSNDTNLPTYAYAPSANVFPTTSLLRNTIKLDYDHSYGSKLTRLGYSEVDVSKLREFSTALPTPAYPKEERLSSGSDIHLLDARYDAASAPMVLKPMYKDKTDMDFVESVTLKHIIPPDMD